MLAQRQKRSGGFTLVEVLVAMLVFAIALLGMAQLFLRGYSSSMDMHQRTAMTVSLQDLTTRMRVNPDGLGSYVGTHTKSTCSSTPSPRCSEMSGLGSVACTPAELADSDLWMALCGNSGDDGMADKVIDWKVVVSCTDGGCTSDSTEVWLQADWVSRRGDTDKRLTGDVSADLDGTGAESFDANTDRMLVVFSPW